MRVSRGSTALRESIAESVQTSASMDTEQGAGPLDVPRPGPSDAPLSPTAEEPSLDGLITSAGASPHANVPVLLSRWFLHVPLSPTTVSVVAGRERCVVS